MRTTPLPPARPMFPTLPETPDARKSTTPGTKIAPWSLALAALVGCYVGPLESDNASAPSTAADAGPTLPPMAEGGATTSGVPCEVSQALTRNKCLDCHGSALAAPMPLLSRSDLLASGKSDASKKVIELAIARMQSTTLPMPPAPSMPASAADIAVLQQWVSNGYPEGTCGASAKDAGAVSTTPKCTSGTYWSPGEEAPEMNPGTPCIACHQAENARRRRERAPAGIGGTVFPSLHEPDLCFGAPGGATVIITDAQNQQFQLPVNATGNFFLYGTVAFPIRAKVVSAGKERAMNTPQMSGDCNSCHTASGSQGAPGRIMLP